MKSLVRTFIAAALVAFLFSACKSHKPKCRTCPKWEDRVELNK